jgi:hypothetical protein
MLESRSSREELIAVDQREINRELGRPDTPISRPRALGSMEPQSRLVTVRATLPLALNVLRPALPSLVSLTDPAGRLS